MDYGYLFSGVSVAYVARMEEVPQALLEVRPQVAGAVPRFFEKLYGNILERGAKATGFNAASSTGPFAWSVRLCHGAPMAGR